MITMANGSTKPIRDLAVGDMVRGKSGINRVIAIPKRHTEQTIYGFNGGKAFVTGGHPFYTREGWKAIDPSLTPSEKHNVRTTRCIQPHA
jgi:hypothetical protein